MAPVPVDQLHDAHGVGPPWTWELTRCATLAGPGAAIGAAAPWLRPYAQFAGVHLEAVLAVFVLLPSLCLAAVLTRARRPTLPEAPNTLNLAWTMGEIASIWACAFMGWSLADGQPTDSDLLGIMLAGALLSALVGRGLFALVRKLWPRIVGPYCRGCGYCLIGSRERCPECGRAYTRAELRLDADDGSRR